MFTVPRILRFVFASFALAILALVPTFSLADTGSVRLKVTKAGFIVGVGGGNGVLHFHGKNYRLTIGGISAGTIGVAGADLVGTATNMHKPSDIAEVTQRPRPASRREAAARS